MPEDFLVLEAVALAGLSAWDAAPFLKKVTDVVPNIIYVHNQETQSNEYSNHSMATSLGYSSKEVREFGPNILSLLCHPDDIGRIGSHLEKLRKLDDGKVLSIEYRTRHKLGYWVWMLSHDTVFDRDEDGNVIRHIGVASDITAQKVAKERAVAAQLRAEATNDELRAFSYSMSHDLKSPSNTLHLLLTELLDTHGATLDPDAGNLVDMALATVDRMGQLIDGVQHYTHVVGQDIAVGPFDLNEILAEVVFDLKASIRSKDAVIEIADLPTVLGDRTQIRIFFRNLIENALKFHPVAARPHVWVNASEEEDSNDISITVQDNGIGIEPGKHEQVFTIFKRLNSETDFSGTGLGLAICRRIAVNHGSIITLVSNPGEGAAFSIRLPRA